MSSIIHLFLKLPLFWRAALSLLLLFGVLWWLLGEKILWLASSIPYILRKLYHGLYYLIEIPISYIHRRVGGAFFSVANGISRFGQTLDHFLAAWYRVWHGPKGKHLGLSVVVYVLLVLYIAVPATLEAKNPLLLFGRDLFLRGEDALVARLEGYKWYNPVKPASSPVVNAPVPAKEEAPIAVNLVVSATNVPLKIRDIPSVKNCQVLGQIALDEVAAWSGQLTFGEGEYGNIEPWVKIKNQEGVEGWSRLYYLHPQEEAVFKLDTAATDIS